MRLGPLCALHFNWVKALAEARSNMASPNNPCSSRVRAWNRAKLPPSITIVEMLDQRYGHIIRVWEFARYGTLKKLNSLTALPWITNLLAVKPLGETLWGIGGSGRVVEEPSPLEKVVRNGFEGVSIGCWLRHFVYMEKGQDLAVQFLTSSERCSRVCLVHKRIK